ncbi:MAG: MFS transporter [Planctomycetes bacterium]|nr:MFS transporter [Planctomycetota bacterium]
MEELEGGSGRIAAIDLDRRQGGRWAMASLALAMSSASLGTSVVNVALPELAERFHSPFATVQWLVIAYLLTSTAGMVAVGRLGDRWGPRRLLLAGLALFVVASIACAVAPSLAVLIAARAFQGAGAAVLMTSSVALARGAVDKPRVGAAMGLLATTSAVGTALGPSLGGALVATLGWRSVFLANVPLAVLALVIGARSLPTRGSGGDARRGRFDVRGTVVLSATLIAFALALTVGRGSVGPWSVGLGFVAIAGGVAFVAVERRAEDPLIPLAMLREGGIDRALLASCVVSAVMMATLVVGPFYLVQGLALDTGAAGLVMSTGPLIAAITGWPAGRLVDRVGARRVALAGQLAVVAGAAALAAFGGARSLLAYVLPLAVMTAGYALFQAANNTAVMAEVSEQRRGVVSGLLGLSRSIGLMTGATVLGSVFASACGGGEIRDASADAVVVAMQRTFAVAAALMAIALVATREARASRSRTDSERELRPRQPADAR